MIPIKVNLPLKQVTARIRSTRAVTWAITTYQGRLLPKLEEIFGPLLDEGELMPFETQLTLFHKKLTAGIAEVVATDRAYRDQRARESKFRSVRDAAFSAVSSQVVVLRQAFGGVYTDETLAEMGFARRTPQNPGELLEQTEHLAVRLSEPDIDLTDAKLQGFEVDVPQAAHDLGPAVEKLRISIDELTREERSSEAAMLAKDEALEEYNGTFLYIARSVESYLRLVGLDEVARRVRPSGRRPGLTIEESVASRNGESGAQPSEDGSAEDGGGKDGGPEADTPPEGPADAPASSDAPSP